MTTPMLEERVSRMEGGYEHLATKADVERMRAEFARWMFQQTVALIGAMGVIAGIVAAIVRFTG